MQLFTAARDQLNIVRDIALVTWPEAYKEILSLEQLQYMLNLFYSIPSLQEQFDSGHRFRICTIDDRPAGFSSVSSKEDEPSILRLNKLYVDPSIQGRGAGRFLLEDVKQFAAAENFRTVELNVNRNNRAQTFYKRQGFSVSHEVDLPIGRGYFMNDYIMTWPVSS